MTASAKIWLGMAVASVVLVAAAALALTGKPVGVAREDVLPQSTAVLGSRDQKVYVVEWSDFQCPACKAAQPAVDAMLKQYGDRIVFGYRHFPLQQHEWAMLAAQAAQAAAAQGKFWEMHDFLFAQESLSREVILGAGKEIGLDEQKYQEDLDKQTYKDAVLKDMLDGNRFGIRGTPTFFVNGRKVNLASFDGLAVVVATELQSQ